MGTSSRTRYAGRLARAGAAVLLGGLLAVGCAQPFVGEDGPGRVRDTAAGPALVDDAGMTMYVYAEDAPMTSNCDFFCAEVWPPVEAPPNAATGGDYDVITRTSGRRQWTYKGQPLYTYVGDDNPGDAYGHGDDEVWFVATP